jgi:hypothetical protein
MKHISHPQAGLAAQLLDLTQDFWERRARNHPVLQGMLRQQFPLD